MEKVFLVKDPFHDYASRFIEVLHARTGYRALCYFSDRKRRVYEQRNRPILCGPAVAAWFELSHGGLVQLAEDVRSSYQPVAVVPYSEECVASAAALTALLALDWNDPQVLRRFRDKSRLKAHLRRVDPSLRLNESLAVRGPDDVLERVRTSFSRYVLKPNEGYGNRGIGIFDSRAPRGTIASFFAESRGASLILEEYIDGVEYFVNGQIDARGVPHVVAVFRYVRAAANGRENIDYQTYLVHTDDPAYAAVTAYAARVMRATGLVRSPFHLELKVDGAGPCLIEVGARLPGLRNAFVCDMVHGATLDIFGLAAHYYACGQDIGPPRVNWSAYDGVDVRYAHGIAGPEREFCDRRGITQVEALSTFHHWAVRPSVGQRMRPTVDCLSMPWSIVLACARGGDLDADEAKARAVLGRSGSRLSVSMLVTKAEHLATRASNNARWQIDRLASITRSPDRGSVVLRVRRKLQEARIGLRYADSLQEMTPSQVATASTLLAWARTYLTAPHRDLGRKGPVCPFVARTLGENRFLIAVHEEIEPTEAAIRDMVLSHADSFRRRYPAASDSATSLLIALPNLPERAHSVLDAVHESAKTYLMTRRLMTASLHPRSTRPAINNPAFPVLRAPIPSFAIRHMVVQDIVFVGHNREAWQAYCDSFHLEFARGKVSNELGYVSLYEAARARFGA